MPSEMVMVLKMIALPPPSFARFDQSLFENDTTVALLALRARVPLF
jgi:hypothetical protein